MLERVPEVVGLADSVVTFELAFAREFRPRRNEITRPRRCFSARHQVLLIEVTFRDRDRTVQRKFMDQRLGYISRWLYAAVSSCDENRVAENGPAVDAHGALSEKHTIAKVARVHAAQISTVSRKFCQIRKLPEKVLPEGQLDTTKSRERARPKKAARDRHARELSSVGMRRVSFHVEYQGG